MSSKTSSHNGPCAKVVCQFQSLLIVFGPRVNGERLRNNTDMSFAFGQLHLHRVVSFLFGACGEERVEE
jgi:hypothetical protein